MRFLVLLPAGALLAYVGCSSDSNNDPGGDGGPGADGGQDSSIPGDAGGGGDSGPAPVNCVGATPYDAWVSDPRLCVYTFATGVEKARQMAFAPNGDLFVSNTRVTVLWDANKNGKIEDNEKATFANASRLNHGLAFSPDYKYIYASSDTTVYRWAYTSGAHAATGAAQVVIENIPAGGHGTRTLAFDSQGRLYVSVGSAGNIDDTEDLQKTRSQIRRFKDLNTIPQNYTDATKAEIVASGMRNEVGLFVDAQDRLWGVENGRDNLSDPELGGDIHNDNPGEEINLVTPGQGSTFYGYPFCWSEFKVATGGNGGGTQWLDQSTQDSVTHPAGRGVDSWCKNPANVRPPAFSMQAHWAPLGIFQYTGNSLPFSGDFIVAAHGSWNRSPATGKLIARARYQNGVITSVEPIVGAKDAAGKLAQGANGAPRPVDVRQGPDQALYFSDDEGGRVFKIGYRQP